MDIEESVDLWHSSRDAQMAEMHRIDSHRPCALGHDDRLQGALLNAVLGKRAVLRQQVIARGHDRRPRQDHRAELPPAINQPARGVAVTRVHVEIGAVDPMVLGQMRPEHGRSVDATRALPVALHLLQGDDVGGLDLAGDAREVVPVVLAEPVLNVIGDEFLPAAKRAVALPGQAARFTDFVGC